MKMQLVYQVQCVTTLLQYAESKDWWDSQSSSVLLHMLIHKLTSRFPGQHYEKNILCIKCRQQNTHSLWTPKTDETHKILVSCCKYLMNNGGIITFYTIFATTCHVTNCEQKKYEPTILQFFYLLLWQKNCVKCCDINVPYN